jgi:hypothetical protein
MKMELETHKIKEGKYINKIKTLEKEVVSLNKVVK